MLFYESAKCLHGRRSQLKGKYYGSIFVHYQPVDPKIWNYSVEVCSSVLCSAGAVCHSTYRVRWAVTTRARLAFAFVLFYICSVS
jgi:hypothetical protein